MSYTAVNVRVHNKLYNRKMINKQFNKTQIRTLC